MLPKSKQAKVTKILDTPAPHLGANIIRPSFQSQSFIAAVSGVHKRLGLIIKAVREDMSKIGVVAKLQAVITVLTDEGSGV